MVNSMAEHRKELARVVQKSRFAYVALFERMVSEMTRIAQENKHGNWPFFPSPLLSRFISSHLTLLLLLLPSFAAAACDVAALEGEIAQLKVEKADLVHMMEVQDIDRTRYQAVQALYQAQNAEIKALKQVKGRSTRRRRSSLPYQFHVHQKDHN